VWIPQLPRALHWNHNAFYHRKLVRQLPDRLTSALDVGCGHGGLVELLALRADHVDGVDVSARMIGDAKARSCPNVRWLLGDVLDDSLPLAPGGYHLVTAVASLHHLPLRPALRRLAGLVRPGGVLVVIGLYRPATVADRLADVVAVPANAARGAMLAVQGRAGQPHNVGMPMLDPKDTLAEIGAAAAEYTPGALLRRRLYFRYSLLWLRPR
jgi:SAM-dependent methyltransferase